MEFNTLFEKYGGKCGNSTLLRICDDGQYEEKCDECTKKLCRILG